MIQNTWVRGITPWKSTCCVLSRLWVQSGQRERYRERHIQREREREEGGKERTAHTDMSIGERTHPLPPLEVTQAQQDVYLAVSSES